MLFIFQPNKKAKKKQRYRATDSFFFFGKLSYRATELQSYRPLFFSTTEKKLQRNGDTELQTPFFSAKKSYKETKIQSYRPDFFFREKKATKKRKYEATSYLSWARP